MKNVFANGFSSIVLSNVLEKKLGGTFGQKSMLRGTKTLYGTLLGRKDTRYKSHAYDSKKQNKPALSKSYGLTTIILVDIQ